MPQLHTVYVVLPWLYWGAVRLFGRAFWNANNEEPA